MVGFRLTPLIQWKPIGQSDKASCTRSEIWSWLAPVQMFLTPSLASLLTKLKLCECGLYKVSPCFRSHVNPLTLPFPCHISVLHWHTQPMFHSVPSCMFLNKFKILYDISGDDLPFLLICKFWCFFEQPSSLFSLFLSTAFLICLKLFEVLFVFLLSES